MEAEILDIIKQLLGINDIEKDELFKLYIKMFAQRVMNYCRISEIPEELYYNIALQVVDIHNGTVEAGQVKGSVASITEDNRTVEFDSGEKAIRIARDMDERVARMHELKEFRQLYKVN